MAELGKVFIISGPAGVGKSTVRRRLLQHFPRDFGVAQMGFPEYGTKK
jgi:guanylate kinase